MPNQVIDGEIALVRRHLDQKGFRDIELRKMGGGDEWSRTSVKVPVVQAVLSVYCRYGVDTPRRLSRFLCNTLLKNVESPVHFLLRDG